MPFNQKQFARVAGLLLFLGLLYYVQDAIYPLVVAVIIFYLLDPLVSLLSRPRPGGPGLNRTVAILLAAAVFVLTVGLLVSVILPPFISEFNRLSGNMPHYIETVSRTMDTFQSWYADVQLPSQVNTIISNSLQDIVNYMLDFTQQAVSGLINLLSQFINLVIIPIMAFYLLKDKERLFSGLIDLLPQDHQKKTAVILKKINALLKNYFRGVFMLCLLVGFLCGLGLYFLGVSFFLILGLIAAVTEFIPVIGPFIGAVPAVIIGFIGSPALAAQVVVLYLAIQSLESSILVPRILGERLNLHPISVILALLILSRLIGAWGLFFAAPIAGMIKILYLELRQP